MGLPSRRVAVRRDVRNRHSVYLFHASGMVSRSAPDTARKPDHVPSKPWRIRVLDRTGNGLFRAGKNATGGAREGSEYPHRQEAVSDAN